MQQLAVQQTWLWCNTWPKPFVAFRCLKPFIWLQMRNWIIICFVWKRTRCDSRWKLTAPYGRVCRGQLTSNRMHQLIKEWPRSVPFEFWCFGSSLRRWVDVAFLKGFTLWRALRICKILAVKYLKFFKVF